MSKKRPQIEDTSRRDPLIHAAVLFAAGSAESTKYITDMEKAGQKALVESDQIPRELNGCTEADLVAMGFELLPPEDDELFRPAVLPKGWTREGSSHDMWSYIRDENGFKRVAVFYKAAFYDRRAHLSIESRFHVRKDYDAEKEDGTLRWHVYAASAQGGEGTVMAVFEQTEKFPEDQTKPALDRGPRPSEYWAADDELRKAAQTWILKTFPDPKTHWDPKLTSRAFQR